jgi:hypothetical protein
VTTSTTPTAAKGKEIVRHEPSSALERSAMLTRLIMLERDSNGENLASSTPASTQEWPSHSNLKYKVIGRLAPPSIPNT